MALVGVVGPKDLVNLAVLTISARLSGRTDGSDRSGEFNGFLRVYCV